MGQVFVPGAKDIILTDVDRLVARNADGGLSPLASHIVLLGENAGRNLGDVDHVYVTGSDSLSGGLASAAQEGTTVYGANNLTALTNAVAPGNDGPMVVMGFNNLATAVSRVGSSVVIGSGIAATAPAQLSPFDSSIVLGQDALGRMRTLNANGGTFARGSVIAGFRALRGLAFANEGGGTSVSDVVFLGNGVGENSGFDDPAPGNVLFGTIAIGARALRGITAGAGGRASTEDIAIGWECGLALRSSQRNVMIGAELVTGTSDIVEDVLLGSLIQGAHANNAGNNVAVGSRIDITGWGSRSIVLGSGANSLGDIPNGGDYLLIETVNSTSGVRRNLIYGNMGTLTGAAVTACGIVLGLSGAANRDLPGMNIVKLVNGAWDGTLPVGGGLLYSGGGALHWVDTAGSDNTIGGSSIISPAALAAGNTNNYAPAGFSSANVIRQAINAAGSTLTGLAGGTANLERTIYNLSAAAFLNINNEDAGSTAANRFLTPTAVPVSVSPQGSITVWYDATSSRWRVKSYAL